MSKIEQIIKKQFDSNRLLFWYDPTQEFRDEYWALQLPDGCEKIEVVHDAFGVKHRILIKEPDKKFLLYFAYEEPSHQDNWLLDLQLSEGVVQIDQGSLWLQELGLDRNRFIEITREHKYFFKSLKRLVALKGLVTKDTDVQGSLRLKMLSVCATCEARWDEVMLSLLSEFASGKNEKLNLIGKCGLDSFFWEQIAVNYGYTSEQPNLKSLSIELFSAACMMGDSKINRDGKHALKLMKDLSQYREPFDRLSLSCAVWIDAPTWLEKQSLETLSELDYFEYAERLIINSMIVSLDESRIGSRELLGLIMKRRSSHWYQNYENQYQCLSYASEYLDRASIINAELHGLESGFKAYYENLYQMDLLYRKFCLYYGRLPETKSFESLSSKIGDHYGNSFIFKLGTTWSAQMKQQEKWPPALLRHALGFWKIQITPYIQQNKKIFVIISDALRYEIAAELMSLIRKEDRFEAELSAMVGTLPSITSIGMAALLPHESISFDNKNNVLVDGMSSMGTENRGKILSKYHPDRSLTLRAEDVSKMPTDKARTLYTDYDVIYVYHNAIDAIGDKLATEEKVFEAVETAINELIALVRKLSSANANNIIITADHGFMYQRDELSEDQFLDDKIILGENDQKLRRCIIGRSIKENPNLLIYKSVELGLSGDTQIAIPYAGQRMRQAGSGSRYVHGGASLQEICLPLLQVSKKRVSDVTLVDVEIRRSGSKTISSGVLVFRLYQVQPVSEKLQGRTLRIALFDKDGEPISELKTMIFDSAETSDKARDIECRLMLTGKADKAGDAILRLDEFIPDTDIPKVYKSETYSISKMFEMDF
ncbi:MAG: BREX-1 system phosphatase PglZ type A [Candidatus Cloacimonetes bacterium]|nr:BREX-1 system phosphatase PglZ type A [Candidatus Cloacimonadota bacterium]